MTASSATLLHPAALRAGETPEKSAHGQFFTMATPFTHQRFRTWLDAIPDDATFIEPFAGANNLVRMVSTLQPPRTRWHCYDIAPRHPDVRARDTLAGPPTVPGPAVVITNPPYLAKNAARRRGRHDVAERCGTHNNLYKACLEMSLGVAGWVAAIVPESFITSGDFRDRLVAVISLNHAMFVDTEVPVCLALFEPDPVDDFDVYRDADHLGTWAHLSRLVPQTPAGTPRMRFNAPDGQVGLVAVDAIGGPTIGFCPADEVPDDAVKETARHLTRIHVAGLRDADAATVIGRANDILARMRAGTHDVTLTAFRGLRHDGRYRRRLDFATTRHILGTALNPGPLAGTGSRR